MQNDNIQELDNIINKVCLSEVSFEHISGYIELLQDITQEINDIKIHALLYSLNQECQAQIKNISDIESKLLNYKNKLNDNK